MNPVKFGHTFIELSNQLLHTLFPIIYKMKFTEHETIFAIRSVAGSPTNVVWYLFFACLPVFLSFARAQITKYIDTLTGVSVRLYAYQYFQWKMATSNMLQLSLSWNVRSYGSVNAISTDVS